MMINQEKRPNTLLLWSIIISFIIISLIGINKFVHFNHYYLCQGVVKNGYISIYVPIDSMENIVNKNKVYINNKIYTYSIKTIKEEVLDSNLIYYQNILIDINDKMVVDVKFILSEKTIFKYVTNFIKGE